MSPSPKDDYRPASALALCVSILLVAQALTAFVSALFDAYQVQLLEDAAFRSPIPPALVEAQDARLRLLAALGLGIELTALVFLLLWVYRANRNARSLGAEDMEYSPGWSVGWFFVPVAGLYVPYFVLKELWKASTPSPTGEWRQAAVSPILGTWWTAWVVSALLQYSQWPVLSGDRTLAHLLHFDTELFQHLALEFREFFCGRLVSDVVQIAVGVLTLVVVVTVTNLQEQRAVATALLPSRSAQVS